MKRLECSVCDEYVILPDKGFEAGDTCFYPDVCTGVLMVVEIPCPGCNQYCTCADECMYNIHGESDQ